MRWVLIAVATLAILYGGYWVVGSTAVEQGAGTAFERLAARGGWRLEHGGINTTGFPSRFDTTVNEPRLVALDGTVVWDAPFVQAFALSYRPNHAIVVWPETQGFFRPTLAPSGRAGPGSPVAVQSERLRASLAVRTRTDLALDAATLEGEGLNINDGASGYALALGRVVAAIRNAAPQGTFYDLSLEGRDVVAGLMDEAAQVEVLATAELDRPLDRRLTGPPRIRALDVEAFDVTVGHGSIHGVGRFAVGAGGTVMGEGHVRVRGWDAVIAALRQAGIIDEGLAVFYQRLFDQAALEGAAQEGGADTVEVPIRIEGGRVTALGLPVGVLPALPPPQAPQRQ